MCLRRTRPLTLDTCLQYRLIGEDAEVYLVRAEVFSLRSDGGHERTILDFLVITSHVYSILTGFSRPEPHEAGAIIMVITLNLCLRRTFNGKTCDIIIK